MTICVDFRPGSRFSHPEVAGEHPVHNAQTKRYGHLNCFQHECFLEVGVPRAKLPDDLVCLIEPPWADKLSGFTPVFVALVLSFSRGLPYAAVARLVGESWHRAETIADRYVELGVAQAACAGVPELAIEETSRAREHDYVTLAADAERRAVIFVTETRETVAIEGLAEDLRAHGGDPEAVRAVSIEMSLAYIRGVAEYLPNAFLEALSGLCQAAKRKARGYRRLSTICTVIFLIAAKLDFRTINPHAA